MAVSDAKKEANRRWREANPEKNRAANKNWRDANADRIRENNLRRMGFTTQLFTEMLDLQSHKCAVCSTDLKELPTKKVHADHCHSTMTPRGVLCHCCNAGLGLFKDNPDLLRAAADYLETRRMI